MGGSRSQNGEFTVDEARRIPALTPPENQASWCFTTSIDRRFVPGAMGLIKSIRRFHGADPDIVVFIRERDEAFADFCDSRRVELHDFPEIESWVLPLVYSRSRYLDDDTHFYHPGFRIRDGWKDHEPPKESGFDRIRHLHPLNVKAYCTGFCLHRGYERVVHIDSDAFLLGPVGEVFEWHPEPDAVVGFDDGRDPVWSLGPLFGVPHPEDFSESLYAFNAGIVFYRNGEGVRELARDFMFYIESCYHYTHCGSFGDQSILRALVAKFHILGKIRYFQHDRINWNPTHRAADHLEKRGDEWVNLRNGRRQFIWHGAGGHKLWWGRYKSESVMAAWREIGGTVPPRAGAGQ